MINSQPAPGASAGTPSMPLRLSLVFLVNILFTMIVLTGCLVGVPSQLRAVPAWIVPFAVASQALFLNLYPGSFVLLFYKFKPASRFLPWFAAAAFGFTQCLVLADVAVYRVFACHLLNRPMIEMLLRPGVGDILRPGTKTVVVVSAVCVATVLGSVWLALWLSPALARRRSAGRVLRICLTGLVVCMICERSVLAWRGRGNETPLISMSDTFTFYIPLDLTAAAEHLGFKARPAPPFSLWNHSQPLAWPRAPLGPARLTNLPNILVIAIESARFDGLNITNMPNTDRLARESWWLKNHFSSGNCTRVGTFSLFNGLPAQYMYYLETHKGKSAPMDYLESLGYDFRIFSSAGLDFTSLTRSAFQNFRVRDVWKPPHVEKDREMTDAFLEEFQAMQATNQARRPFFCFLFYDASHTPYDYPPEDAVHPVNSHPGNMDYAQLAALPGASIHFKAWYLNALHYVDRQIGRVLARLRESGQWDQTVVIIVGDHGEEFGECGHFGHLTGLDIYQTHTLAVLRLPGESPREITNLTSHVDFIPTILQYAGCTNPPGDYSTGLPIQGEARHEFVTVEDLFGSVGVIKAGLITRFRPSGVIYQTLTGEDADDDPHRLTKAELDLLQDQYQRFLQDQPGADLKR